MFSKKIKSKLHKFLFPRFHRESAFVADKYNDAVEEIARLHDIEKRLQSKEAEFQKVYYKMKAEEAKQFVPKPTMADLMRECLGILPINFTDVIEDPSLEEKVHMSPEELAKCDKETGMPKDFLDTVIKDKREIYISQLYQIWQMEVFPIMIDYYINLQGNWSFKKAIDDMQLFAGRLSCNGIYLIKNKVKAGFDEYKERSKPPEEFDEHELDEGFDISNLTKKDK